MIRKPCLCVLLVLVIVFEITYCPTLSKSKEKRIPIASGAFKYSSDYWNVYDRIVIINGQEVKVGNVMFATNCYAYAFNFKKNPKTGEKYCIDNNNIGLQPGELSKSSSYIPKMTKITKSEIVGRVASDMQAINYKFTELKGKTLYSKIKNKKTSLVCLVTTKYPKFKKVFDKKKKIAYYYLKDYHWYRQDKDGYWSHKRGRTKVIRVDSKKKKIKNPIKCNKTYVTKTNTIIRKDGIKYKKYYVYKYSGKGGIFKVKRK